MAASRKRLVNHAAFLVQAGPVATERLAASFEAAADSQRTMPQQCPWFKGAWHPRNTYRFLLFEKRYLLIFQIQDDTVYVDYVVDCRQDYGWIIREEEYVGIASVYIESL
ncbi:type II toxin-antitoxin system RelE/ParE family toxin [Clostridiaceae bacterium]|nr:type II toxin-antitoxin system RelE/ParE family toxin [Clostridiaceae bacterium]